MELRLGLSYNHHWWDRVDPEDLFVWMQRSCLTELEINAPGEWAGEASKVAHRAIDAGLRCHFHAPYPQRLDLRGFRRGALPVVEETFAGLFDLALECAVRQGTACVVNLHGASAAAGTDPLELRRSTVDFLKWAAEMVEDYPVRLALEVALYHPGKYRVGQFGGEILDIVKEVSHPALGLGLDMGHCAMFERRRGMPYDLSDEFMRRVVHAHLHDMNSEGEDHGPLIYGNVDYPGYLHWLARKHYRGAVILELDYDHAATAGPVEEMIRVSAQRAREAWGAGQGAGRDPHDR